MGKGRCWNQRILKGSQYSIVQSQHKTILINFKYRKLNYSEVASAKNMFQKQKPVLQFAKITWPMILKKFKMLQWLVDNTHMVQEIYYLLKTAQILLIQLLLVLTVT